MFAFETFEDFIPFRISPISAAAEKEMWENYIKSLYNDHGKDKKQNS